MFISRLTQEQRDELMALRAERIELKVQLAHKTSTNDWLMVRINSLEAERAALVAKLFDAHYPAPVIQRVNEVPAAAGPTGVFGRPIEDGTPAYQVPAHIGKTMRFPTMSDDRPKTGSKTADAEVDDSITSLQVSSTTFEDMGDEAAAQHGIRHDEDGGIIG